MSITIELTDIQLLAISAYLKAVDGIISPNLPDIITEVTRIINTHVNEVNHILSKYPNRNIS